MARRLRERDLAYYLDQVGGVTISWERGLLVATMRGVTQRQVRSQLHSRLPNISDDDLSELLTLVTWRTER